MRSIIAVARRSGLLKSITEADIDTFSLTHQLNPRQRMVLKENLLDDGEDE